MLGWWKITSTAVILFTPRAAKFTSPEFPYIPLFIVIIDSATKVMNASSSRKSGEFHARFFPQWTQSCLSDKPRLFVHITHHTTSKDLGPFRQPTTLVAVMVDRGQSLLGLQLVHKWAGFVPSDDRRIQREARCSLQTYESCHRRLPMCRGCQHAGAETKLTWP